MFTQVCWGSRKKKQNPLCINYNNPTSRERGKKIHAEIKAERPDVIMCQKIKNTTALPTQMGKVCQTYSTFTLIKENLLLPISHHAFARFPSYL